MCVCACVGAGVGMHECQSSQNLLRRDDQSGPLVTKIIPKNLSLIGNRKESGFGSKMKNRLDFRSLQIFFLIGHFFSS